MPLLSDQILGDIAEAYSTEEVIELLDLESIDILDAFRDRVRVNLTRFEIRPIDCHEI